MLRKLAALLIAPAVLAGVALGATAADAAGDANAASFVSRANSERTSRGLRAYVVTSDLVAVAARHSARMASKNSLYHNPALASEVTGWRIVGENVGMGGSVDSIHEAFMDSPDHRANVLSTDYTEIGVGTVTDSRGVLWVTQVFRLPSQAPAVTKPVTQTAARSVTRVPVKQPVVRATVKAAPAAKRAVVAPVRVRAGGTAFLGALAAQAPAANDPFTLALTFERTMSALVR